MKHQSCSVSLNDKSKPNSKATVSISPLRNGNYTRDRGNYLIYLHHRGGNERLFIKVECVSKEIHDIYKVYVY